MDLSSSTGSSIVSLILEIAVANILPSQLKLREEIAALSLWNN